MRNFDVFFVVVLNKLLDEQPNFRSFKTPRRPRDAIVMDDESTEIRMLGGPKPAIVFTDAHHDLLQCRNIDMASLLTRKSTVCSTTCWETDIKEYIKPLFIDTSGFPVMKGQ